MALVLAALSGCSSQRDILKNAEIGALEFSDAQHGRLVGREMSEKKVFLASTQDGGKRWEVTKIGIDNNDACLSGIAFRDAQNGWAVGSHGLAFATKDGGKSWEKTEALGDARALHYREGLGCLVLGSVGYAQRNGIVTYSGDSMDKGRLSSRTPMGRNIDPYDGQIVDDQTLWGYGSCELSVHQPGVGMAGFRVQ